MIGLATKMRPGVAKLVRAGAAAAVAAAVVVALGACDSGPPGPHGPDRLSPHTSAWKDFVEPSRTSGCPSAECYGILAQVAVGAATRTVPSDARPRLQDAAQDLRVPRDGSCSQLPVAGLKREAQPCVFQAGARARAPLMILIGNSRALMWSRALSEIASQLGYRFGVVANEECSMPRPANPIPMGLDGANGCKAWREAAINWVNQQNPAAVLVASGPDLSHALRPPELTDGYAATLNDLQRPGRRVFVFGEVPRLEADPALCLTANHADALACATHPMVAASADEQQAVLDAAKRSGAAYLNVTPWLCTPEICPAIVGINLAYRDRTHLTTTFTETLVPVLKEALGIRHA